MTDKVTGCNCRFSIPKKVSAAQKEELVLKLVDGFEKLDLKKICSELETKEIVPYNSIEHLSTSLNIR